MFGQQNNNTDQNDAAIPQQSIDEVLEDQPVQSDQNVASQNPAANTWQHPGMPIGQASDNSVALAATPNPPITEITPVTGGVTTSNPDANSMITPGIPSEPAAGSDELMNIKQQALSQLSPLVGQLDQSPEDKFRTTMMMIQASDNQALIKDAFAAAQAIPDEKSRAQALLDIVNEINYFTQQHGE